MGNIMPINNITHLSDAKVLAWLGERFKATRLSQNISKAELAAAAGINERTIYNLESGTKSVGLLNVIAILRALDKLDELEQFLLPPPPRADALLKLDKLNAKRRQRASRSQKASPQDGHKEPWTWGDK